MKSITTIILLVLALTTNSFAYYIKNGRFYDVNGVVSIDSPNLQMQTIKVNKGGGVYNAIFTSDRFYWMMDGEYQFAVLSFYPNAKIVDDLYKTISVVINNLYSPRAAESKVQIEQCKYITTAENKEFYSKSYQCIAKATIDNEPATIVATCRITKTKPFYVVNTFALEPRKKAGFNWARYNHFVDSFKLDLSKKKQTKNP